MSQNDDVSIEPGYGKIERNETLSIRVADRLQDLILDGHVLPGERLPSERELANRFGVSRTVVREAVRRLAGKGLLEPLTGSGILVTEIQTSTIRESMDIYLRSRAFLQPHRLKEALAQVHEVRTMLEIQISGSAAAARLDSDMEYLAAEEALMMSAATSVEKADADVAFHRAIAVITHNDLYPVMLESIQGPLRDIRLATFELPPEVLPDAIGAHHRILEAIGAGNVDEAREAMSDHLAGSKAMLDRLSPEHLRNISG